MAETQFICSLGDPLEAFPHFWEQCVGSCHATMALRADWQKQLTRAHKELGFGHVRFHGLLNDDMGTLLCENNKLVYSFFNADQILDFLLSIEMKPFLELSFMPTTLASGGDTVFKYKGNVTPPKDYHAWTALLQKLTKHWTDRYGIDEVKKWFFEIWNEPNLKAFWNGSQADYFRFYELSARALKQVHPELQVGGPATAANEWIAEFVLSCSEKEIPLDFVSTHHYPTDAFGKPGDDTIKQLAASKRSILREQAKSVFEKAKGKPVYYTEWSSSSNPFDDLHDTSYCAAFVTKTIMEARGLVKGYSYWTFSDLFEENYLSSTPFHGGFGLMNIHGIPKPAYRAFEILHRQGESFLPVKGSHPTVDVWATRATERLHLVIVNSQLPEHEIHRENLQIKVDGVKRLRSAVVEMIDEENSNPRRAWEQMNKPDYLKAEEIQKLEEESKLKSQPIEARFDNGSVFLVLSVLPQSVTHITLELT